MLRVGQAAAAYTAFIPHPLPPQLTLDVGLVCALSDADRALGELAGLGRAMPNPHLLIRPFIRREAVLSSRIEGAQTDIGDLYAYEAGQLPPPGPAQTARESDVREVHNYVTALEYGLERINTLPVSLRLLRELHERLLAGVRGEHATPGEFRRSQNWIGAPGCTLNDAAYVPPPVADMHAALDALEKYLHAECVYPPLVRIGLIHYQFEAIHPFVDGNGRIGRLLITLLLIHWNLLPLPLLYLSAYFERQRAAYYDLLFAVSQRGDWRDWLLFFLRGVAEQARDAVRRARRLQDLQTAWRARLIQGRAPAHSLRLADSLFQSPVLTIPQAQAILGVSYPTAQHTMRRLIEAGILQQVGKSAYSRTFFAPDILAAVSQSNG